MISHICNHCKRLNNNCDGVEDNGYYTGCAQKKPYYTEYGEHLLSFFKERCINSFGYNILFNQNLDYAIFNCCVVSDELFAGWLLLMYENSPSKMFEQLETYSHGNDDYPISVVLYSNRSEINSVDTYITEVGKIKNLLNKAVK